MIGWLDCSAGVSGDMLLGALVDAGVPLRVLADAVGTVAPERVQLRAERVTKNGIVATKVHVDAVDSTLHRTWRDVRTMLEQKEVLGREHALRTFESLATAEAAVHGTAPEQVHFHEVGALDAIADIVGACAGFAHLDLDQLVVSPVALGGGTVRAAHGELAVPGPAVVRLLLGVPTYGGPVDVELTTPTGAALLTTWASSWGVQPAMQVASQGFGAGTRDLPGRANVLRLVLGASAEAGGDEEISQGLVIETNVDDLDGRIWPHVLTALLDAGADDAWLVPILMKKGRSAHTLRVLTSASRAEAIRRIVVTQTSAIGLREVAVTKHALERSVEPVTVGGRPIRVKVARYDGAVVNAQPEWDDVVATAEALASTPKRVLAQAVAAYWSERDAGPSTSAEATGLRGPTL